jgi:hypothetical protein
MVLDFLLTAQLNQLSRKQILRKGYGHFDAAMLDRILENLLEMEWIAKVRVGVGKNIDWTIKLAGEPLAAYKKFRQSRG